jgi:hypothetical protein
MLHASDIASALRMAALWLLVVCVFLGPAGLGGSIAFASPSRTCAVSCPCDEEVRDPHAGDHEEHADAEPCDDDGDADSEHQGSDPCQDDCPDDCPNCGCCLGVAMAVLPLSVASSAVTSAPARTLAPIDAPASGSSTGVFRPPRSLN